MLAKKTYLSFLFIIFVFLSFSDSIFARVYKLKSPGKQIEVRVHVNQIISYEVHCKGKILIKPSPISMTIHHKNNNQKFLPGGPGGTVFSKRGVAPPTHSRSARCLSLGASSQKFAEKTGFHKVLVKRVHRRQVNETITSVVPVKSRLIRDRFNELTIDFKKEFSLDFRAYDDGIAYRFRTRLPGSITVASEEVVIDFVGDYTVYFPEEESFMTHQERLYKILPLSKITSKQMASLPSLVETDEGIKVVITESDLWDYPGMYITGSEKSPHCLQGTFPGVALEEKRENDRNIRVTKRADYLAVTKGTRGFPWRVFVIAFRDEALVESQLVFQLARPLQLKDTSWIKPGKVAWDWWNANNILGVDFPAGINTDTYKYYIDFAANYNLEYIILDEGWYKLGNLMDINPDINMDELFAYAKKKKVGIILWVVWKTLEDQLQEALDQFEKWGVKGIKVDFMQRDDQEVVNFYWKIAGEAAKRRMVVDFHGSYKPSGLRRAFPNVLTREGVKGLEHSKWSENASPENAVTIPFIRMLAGPMDYTPGAMINRTKENFKPIFKQPMSQGTRCHQLAMYVVYESPLQMLADSPSNYYREKECMEFLSKVPTVWDETKVLAAKLADYILVARKYGNDWYVGAMTDWTARELTVDFSFLEPGSFRMIFYEDGVNAHRLGSDYKKRELTIDNNQKLTIKLAPGGGWAARIME
jgi:alpha-glucosidase